jgi:rRNA pseudouridine-1189 N-methylase Emg1 (Nep1/Mra1 family)
MFGSGGVAEDSFADFHTWAAKKVHDARSEAGRTGAERKHANDHAKKEVKKRKRAKPEITHVGSEDALDAIANDSQRKGITLPD